MNDTLTQAISLLIGAITTTILMAASFYFGPGARRDRDEDRKLEDRRRRSTDKEDEDE